MVLDGAYLSVGNWWQAYAPGDPVREQELNRLSDRIFHQLAPELQGRQLTSTDGNYIQQLIWLRLRRFCIQVVANDIESFGFGGGLKVAGDVVKFCLRHDD